MGNIEIFIPELRKLQYLKGGKEAVRQRLGRNSQRHRREIRNKKKMWVKYAYRKLRRNLTDYLGLTKLMIFHDPNNC